MRRADGSKPVVGSSRNTSSGSPTSATPRSSRRFCPPERVFTRASALSASPTSSITSSTGRGRLEVAREHPVHLPHAERGGQLGVLQHDPDPLAVRRAAPPGIGAEHGHLARVARAVSSRISTVVVLPAPFGPRSPNTSPGWTSKSIPRTASTPSYAFRRPRTRIAGSALTVRGAAPSSSRARARSLPVRTTVMSEQSGWWPTAATGPEAPATAPRRASTVAPGASAGSRRSAAPVSAAIASAVWRARTRGLVSTVAGGSARPARRAPSACAGDALGGQLAKLVRVAGRGLGVVGTGRRAPARS